MARIRTIKPEFFDDEDLCALSPLHRLCYAGLWCQADKAGRLEDRPKRLKARLLPFDEVDMDVMLTDLVKAGFIIRYVIDGKQYITIKPSSWEKHQRPRNDEPESVLPPVDAATVFVASLGSDESVTPQSLGKERKGKELERKESLPPEADKPPAVLMFPTVGTEAEEWGLTQELVSSWDETFPALDVLGECRKARAWIIANPDRRKTVRGMQKFLLRWLSRATDSFRGAVPERPKLPRPAPKYESDWFEECKRVHGGTCELDRHRHAVRMQSEGAA